MSSPSPLKRRRIYRACDQCRRRKSKCDGEQPVCSICNQANRTCTYETGGGRRGLPSGYVRSLEIALGLIIRNSPNSESTLRDALRNSRSQGNFLTSKLAKQSVSTWRQSKPYKDVSKSLEPGSEDDTILDDAEWEPAESMEHDDDTADHHDTKFSNANQPNKLETIQEEGPQYIAPQSSFIIDIKPPDNTPGLVDFYFTYTHCWFPILERRSVLRTMHLGTSNDNINGHGDENLSSRMVLWSLIAYTSAMQGTTQPGMPNICSLQLAIEHRTLTNWDSLDLRYIQALLILVLMHIALGNIHQAWTLIGKAARMLAVLPLPARTARFNHTLNGCVILDNVLSALLDRTPCLSQEEQLSCHSIEEDDIEEWDVWIPHTGDKRAIASTPLRALSTFNHMNQLMQQLSRIMYQGVDTNNAEILYNDLRTKQNAISRSHPYDRRMNTSPPLLNLHLLSAFTTISFCRRFEPVSSTTLLNDSCTQAMIDTIDILDHYRNIAGATGSSPLSICFALQCRNGLALGNLPDSEALQQRISSYSHPLKPVGCDEWKSHTRLPPLEQDQESRSLGNSFSTSTMTEMPNQSVLPITQPHTEQQAVMNLPTIPSTEFPALESLSETGDAEMYDALFEEMVTNFPVTRQEPAFAHNLGFYNGDLDTDFLAQLQQPPS
ncbi:uncharacterized protein N7469_001707 [Penicillium citrinum]|uniref:Zn(2)-C6 fungal-type domain-containing protein n=1 Tax=Penicillium citrinum TaxID=5077 RepID=A0A9W9PEZ6_PENCI|nr:uncharacterized protein N7469_001707 [Penicillium citrinum]KAJ5243380.1 hypothetical protein N7469_001707 [Penicillium citrinum]